MLLERLGFCGGTPVAGMIHTLDAVRSCEDPATIVVGGYATALVDELTAMGGMGTMDNPSEVISVHPEFMKIATDRLLKRVGVRVLYHATAVDSVMVNNAVTGVEVALRDGRASMTAQCVVDGTGNAEIAAFAGAEWALDKELQAITYHFRLGNVAAGIAWTQLEVQMREAMTAAERNGNPIRYGGPWVIRLNEQEVSVNATRVYGNPLDPEEMTRAEMDARENMLAIWHVLRRSVPALNESYILAGATELHVRESRKVTGEYVLTEEDIRDRRAFEDVVALGAWPVDIHPTDGYVGVHPHKENPPSPYQIPYRCLVPVKIDGLLVAGRPISTTHRAHGSTRVPGTSMATGHAAGVAAAMSSAEVLAPRHMDIAKLQKELLRQGAILATQITTALERS